MSPQINHAVFAQKFEYDESLFADAAMDIFHLRNTDGNAETKPAWLGYLTPGVDVDAAQLSLVQALGRCVPVVPAVLLLHVFMCGHHTCHVLSLHYMSSTTHAAGSDFIEL